MEVDFLKDFYKNSIKEKIFKTKLNHDNRDIYLLFNYDYDNELDNFKNTFLMYLPYYIRSYDQLITIDRSDLIHELERRSKKVRTDKIIPQRKKEVNGLYGELFLDFYLRIVCGRNSLITYAHKRAFGSNQESFGPDNVVYYIENNSINVCFCETKFVQGAANAKNKLVNDILGIEGVEESHISKKFLNEYMGFIVEQGINLSDIEKMKFKDFITELNIELEHDKKFVELLEEKGVIFNFVFFAIFNSTFKDTFDFIDYYDDIYDKAKNKVLELGISKYKI